MPAGLKKWEQAGGGGGGGRSPAAYKAVFMKCWEDASLADTQKQLEPAHLLLVAGHKVLQQKATRDGQKHHGHLDPHRQNSRELQWRTGGSGGPSYPDTQRHTPRCVSLLSGGL